MRDPDSKWNNMDPIYIRCRVTQSPTKTMFFHKMDAVLFLTARGQTVTSNFLRI